MDNLAACGCPACKELRMRIARTGKIIVGLSESGRPVGKMTDTLASLKQELKEMHK